ncbi:hypothetical protein N7522_005305 [Penicillium canescens]|nr:hypothetical protein N7522_005319 [Penicillium canescens]KAJ6010289.1 hypothetical protein N7522_005305 [Penicillium canescens]
MTIAVSRPTIRGSQFETDSSPRHKLQEDEPLRKAMLSFLRTQLGQSGGQSANRAIIILYRTGFYLPNHNAKTQMNSVPPSSHQNYADDGRRESIRDFGTSHQPSNPP